jgi:hypothetical protein
MPVTIIRAHGTERTYPADENAVNVLARIQKWR